MPLPGVRCIGIDLGGTNAAAVRLGPDGSIETRASVPADEGPVPPISALITAVERVWRDGAAAIGVGAAGLVTGAGILRWAPHLPGTEVDLARAVRDRFGVPVAVDNDANTAALAEFTAGAGRGYRHGLLVTVGTGIGGGIVVDGAVRRGAGFAGEIGHMVRDPAGPECSCGRRGCWEAYVSGPALARAAAAMVRRAPDGPLARRLNTGRVTGEAVAVAARDGDDAARDLLAAVGAEFGRGLADLDVILDPEVIVVGGGVAQAGELFLGPARSAFAAARYAAGHRPEPPITAAAFGTDAGAVGAAFLAAGEVCP